jgi:tetratricopeptide (TPR) repeat protein
MHAKKTYTLVNTLLLFLAVFIFPACKNERHPDQLREIILGDGSEIKNEKSRKWFEKGLYYVKQQDYAWAKKCFITADHLYPNSPIILNAIGISALRTKDDSSASLYFEKALRIDSAFIKTYVNYGYYLNEMKQYDAAKKILYLGLRRNPQHLFLIDRSVLYLNLAVSYYFLNNSQKALTLLDSARQGIQEGRLYDQIMDFKVKIISESRLDMYPKIKRTKTSG